MQWGKPWARCLLPCKTCTQSAELCLEYWSIFNNLEYGTVLCTLLNAFDSYPALGRDVQSSSSAKRRLLSKTPCCSCQSTSLSVRHKLKFSQMSRGIHWSFKPLHSLFKTCCMVIDTRGFVSTSVCFRNVCDEKSKSDQHLPPALNYSP